MVRGEDGDPVNGLIRDSAVQRVREESLFRRLKRFAQSIHNIPAKVIAKKCLNIRTAAAMHGLIF